MHRFIWRPNTAFRRPRAALNYRFPCIFSSSSVVLKADKISNDFAEKSRGFVSEIDRLGVRRYLDIHKSSSLLLSAKERAESFDALWSKIIKEPLVQIDVVNKYLYCVMDCGMSFDAQKILEDLKKLGVKPNIRTYGAFIRQSCSRGNMEETSYYLQLLQDAHMVPDLNIFSKILYGYLKAGSPEEVASTQEIMKQLGSWPSRLGYEGILTAHAELGDRVSLIQTLNEACDTLTHWSNVTDKVRQNLPFSNVFLVQLYTKLHCAEAVPGEPCMELLSRLPLTLEPISQSRARDGIKRLLVFGRAEAASELFKRIDPESADDAFLTSLARYATVGGLDSEAISRLWRLADASGARLNMLRRINSNEFRRHNTKVSDMFVRLQESFSKKDVEGIFQAIESKRTEASATIYNHAIPQLLALGLKPTEILERIKPESVRPAAAFGCLLGTLAPLPKEGDKVPVVDLKAADALLQSLKNQNLLPYTDFVSISPFVCRRLLQSSSENSTESQAAAETLASKLTVLSGALSHMQTKAVVTHMFETALRSTHTMSNSSHLSESDKNALNTLVDACIIKDIKFPPNSWIFYSLENTEISKEKYEKLKLPNFPSDILQDRRLPLGRRLRTAVEARDIDGAISMIQKISRSRQAPEKGDGERVPPLTSIARSAQLDPVAMAYEVIKQGSNESGTGVSRSTNITAPDVERLFWSSWEAQILPNPLRAIGQVASSYLMTKDLDGMASYFDRSSKQFGNMLETILTQQNMKALLDHNFEANLGLLEQMIANPFLPISTATTAACALENLIQQYGSKAKALEHWKHGTSEYWPIQILNKRFQGISHLQKLRNIHNAVDDLCKSGNLFAAHSLRQWATQMGLLLFPKTNELMVLTPYFVTPSFRAYPLEKWALSHDLCQHTPVSLSGRQLRALDELITSKSIQAANLTSIPHDTAKWLVDNVSEPRSSSHEIDLNNTNCLPTWLVVAQCLQHSGSHFAQPSTWFTLGSTWLDQVPDTSMWLRDLTDWIRFAPSVEHKSALLLAGLFHSKSQSWIIKNYLMNSNAVYSLLVSEAIEQLSEEQRKQLYEILKPQQTNVEAVANVVRELSITPMDMEKVKRAADTIPKDCLTKELASLIGAKPSLKPNVLQFLSKHHPDLVPAFFNDVLATISIRPRFLRLARQFYDDMTEAKIELSQLDVKNQAFMYTAVHLLDPVQSDLLSPLTLLDKLTGSDGSIKWLTEVPAAISRQDFPHLVELIEKSDPTTRDQTLALLTYALPRSGETHRLNKFLTVIAEHMDGNLLQSAVLNARPFISYGIGEAFLALARFYRGEKLDWFDRACIRYHKLGPLLQIREEDGLGENKGTSTVRSKQSTARYVDPNEELSAILRQPLSAVAESLIRAQSDPDQLNSQLALVSASWSIQRRNALLAYLTAEGASQVIERVIALTPESNRLKQLPFQAFATMIQAHYKADVNPEEARKVIQSALSSLAQIPASDIASCLKGPHVESLFRCWPNEKLPELVKFVHDSSPTERSSINLQLTSILINRGRLDLAEQLIKAIGPLPVTFLAGSPRHTLLPEDFKATLKYLRAADPDHVPAFVDTCLRNAASTTSSNADKLISLVRTIVSDPETADLSKACLLPTMNLLAEFLRRNPKLPADVKKLLEFAVEYKGFRRQGSSPA